VGGGRGPPRIDDDELGAAVRPTAALDALEQRRVTLERVGADDEEAIGVIDVLITTGRLVLAINLNVPACGGGHAKPRVAVHVVGADAGLEQLVSGVRFLDQQLAGAIERDRVRAGFLNRVLESGGGEAHRLVPGGVHESVAFADLRREQPPVDGR
jgi:hypothetical protein